MKISKVALPFSLAGCLIATSFDRYRLEPPHMEQYQNLPYVEVMTDTIISTSNATATLVQFSTPPQQ